MEFTPHRCPKCNALVTDRRSPTCTTCHEALPAEWIMTPQQAAKVHELDVHARAEHAAAMEALDPTKDPSMSQTLPILCLKSGAYTIFLSHAAVAAHATLTPFPEPWDNERMTAQFHCLPRVILNPLAIPESEIPWYHLACQAMSAHSSPSA